MRRRALLLKLQKHANSLWHELTIAFEVKLSEAQGFRRCSFSLKASSISSKERQRLVDELMDARRAVKEAAGDEERLHAAHRRVDGAKVALGERGRVWWTDGTPDYNRHLVKNTPYHDDGSA